MITRTLEQLAAMLPSSRWLDGFDGLAKRTAGGVSTDTRSLMPGNLYIPIAGERFNGHAFLQQAADKGAAAALWSRSEPLPVQAQIPLLLVDDTLAAIQQLARAYRLEVNPVVIGITGSNGKTSTKDMLTRCLAEKYKVWKTPGNLNNHLGVPLTLLGMEETTEIAVIEMGMSGLGEIRLLASLARPDIAVITNIGEAHLGDLGSRELIMQAKLEIAEGLSDDGLLIYHGDDSELSAAVAASSALGRFALRTFGLQDGNDYSPLSLSTDMGGSSFTYRSREGSVVAARLPLVGRHQVQNALAAAAAAEYAGLSAEQIAAGFEAAQITGMRNELIQAGPLTLLNDSYKSNPASAKAALDTLAALDCGPSRAGARQKVAVLGDMYDLGPSAEELHRQVGAYVQAEQLDQLVTFGPLSVYTAEEAAKTLGAARVHSFQSKEELLERLQAIVQPDAIVLIKGSRETRLEEVIDGLRRLYGDEPRPSEQPGSQPARI